MSKRESNYKASATEFGKRLTALYKLKVFPRMGKEFAEKLFKSGITAGANISALVSISDAASKVRVAPAAIVNLHETAFAAQVMVEGGFYTAEQIAPLNAYIEKLTEALSGLVSAVKERQTNSEKPQGARTQRIVVEHKPIKRRVIVHSKDELPTEQQIEEYKSVIELPNDGTNMTMPNDGYNSSDNK